MGVILSNTFNEASNTPTPKPYKTCHKKYWLISLIKNETIILKKIPANQMQQHVEKCFQYYHVTSIPGIQICVNIQNYKCDTHYHQNEIKTICLIISTCAENVFLKTRTLNM